MSSIKLTRFGHRHCRFGVITIASEVDGDRLYYGVSYSSPKDVYNKRLGREIAMSRLTNAKSIGDFSYFDDELKHENVMTEILRHIFTDELYPRWAEDLLCRSAEYPFGLKRYKKNGDGYNPVNIQTISVNSEEAKEQLLKALRYLHDQAIDTDFYAVNSLVHMYLVPERIVVEPWLKAPVC